MFAYTDYIMRNGEHRKDIFVSILEYTHPNSSLPRAKVVYHCKEGTFEFHKFRKDLIEPIQLHSDVRFKMYWKGFDYWIDVRADFYKHPSRKWVDETTPYIITELKLDKKDASLEQISEYSNINIEVLRKGIHKELLNYVDELPF